MTPHKYYMIFADNSPEFERSMRYATLMAKTNNAGVFVLTVLSEGDFQLWAGVQERIANEKMEAAEALINNVSDMIKSIADVPIETLIEKRAKQDAVLKTLKTNASINKLVLTTNISGNGKGVILDYFTGAGAHKLSVPLTIVPGHVPTDAIDEMVG